MGRTCSMQGGDEKCKQNVGKLEGKRPVMQPRHGWEYKIKMDLKRNML
jgi:hypothetical protein